MRDIFIDELILATKKNKNIILIVNDLGFGVVEKYKKIFPNNFFNAGISEQSIAGYAAGLASSGKQVFIYSIANFLTFRCAEQIRNDIDYHKLPVTIVSVGSGVEYGNLGYSHHSLQDYALMRCFPNMLIASPGDIMELKASLKYLISHPQPSYLRLSKNSKYVFHSKEPKVSPGKWIKIHYSKKSKNTFLTTGPVAEYTDQILNSKKRESHFSMPIWGQRYKAKQKKIIKKFNKISVVEDHFHDGGFKSWLSESVDCASINTKIISKSISSEVVGKVGSKKFLMNYLK